MQDSTVEFADKAPHSTRNVMDATGDIFEFPTTLFVIILPSYKEDPETLETTLDVLACHPQARKCYHVSQFSSLLYLPGLSIS